MRRQDQVQDGLWEVAGYFGTEYVLAPDAFEAAHRYVEAVERELEQDPRRKRKRDPVELARKAGFPCVKRVTYLADRVVRG